MSDYVILANGPIGPVTIPSGRIDNQFVKSYDPEAHDGQGYATFTRRLANAMRFPSHVAAFEFAMQIPKARPKREDGGINRPLMCFTLAFAPVTDFK